MRLRDRGNRRQALGCSLELVCQGQHVQNGQSRHNQLLFVIFTNALTQNMFIRLKSNWINLLTIQNLINASIEKSPVVFILPAILECWWGGGRLKPCPAPLSLPSLTTPFILLCFQVSYTCKRQWGGYHNKIKLQFSKLVQSLKKSLHNTYVSKLTEQKSRAAEILPVHDQNSKFSGNSCYMFRRHALDSSNDVQTRNRHPPLLPSLFGGDPSSSPPRKVPPSKPI